MKAITILLLLFVSINLFAQDVTVYKADYWSFADDYESDFSESVKTSTLIYWGKDIITIYAKEIKKLYFVEQVKYEYDSIEQRTTEEYVCIDSANVMYYVDLIKYDNGKANIIVFHPEYVIWYAIRKLD